MKQGNTVIVVGVNRNHEKEHPGVITKVHAALSGAKPDAPLNTNITVFPDGMLPSCLGSMPTYESLEAANAAKPALPFAYVFRG